MYTLKSPFQDNDATGSMVVVVGCGGTGSFVAEGLCRLLSRRVSIALIDGDLVESSNLIRQNFLPRELGIPKAEALGERLANQFQRRVTYGTRFLGAPEYGRDVILGSKLIIGCVDNPLARGAIAEVVERQSSGWWVDSGNADNWGQVLIGNASEPQLAQGGFFDLETAKCWMLPLPTLQRTALLLPEEPEEIDPDCAEAVQLGDQGPTINQAMAVLVLEVTRRLIQGTCPWMSLFIDLENGEMKPTFATPDNVARVVWNKKAPEKLTLKPKNRR